MMEERETLSEAVQLMSKVVEVSPELGLTVRETEGGVVSGGGVGGV